MSGYLHILGRRQAENGGQALVVKLQLGDGHKDVAEESNISLSGAIQWVDVSIMSNRNLSLHLKFEERLEAMMGALEHILGGILLGSHGVCLRREW